MVNKILSSFLVFNGLFLATGGLLIAVFFSTRAGMAHPTVASVAANLLLMRAPLTAALANAGLVFLTFLVSLPGLLLPIDRAWLKLHGWLVTLCALFTLVLGLDIWFQTLRTRSNLGILWGRERVNMQSLLQQRFNCCGYLSSTSPPFQQDTFCTSAVVAAQKPGCVGPFSNYANGFLDLVFTAMFGIAALDVILFLCTLMVLRSRAEQARYRHIDEKSGYASI